jgi:hypothetical protein
LGITGLPVTTTRDPSVGDPVISTAVTCVKPIPSGEPSTTMRENFEYGKLLREG